MSIPSFDLPPLHPSAVYPMAPAGGLFIAVMGAAVALGGRSAAARKTLLVAGGVLATLALVTLGPRLDTGAPTAAQLGFLGGSIALEATLLRIALVRLAPRGDRDLFLGVLLAVGVHFLPMAGAFGPACLLLAATCTLNALAGLYLYPQAPIARLWRIDGCVKLLVGAAMLAGLLS